MTALGIVNDIQTFPSRVPHMNSCHEFPNGECFLLFFKKGLSHCCLSDYKSMASCSMFSIPNEMFHSLLPSFGCEAPVLWLAGSSNGVAIDELCPAKQRGCVFHEDVHASYIKAQYNYCVHQTDEFVQLFNDREIRFQVIISNSEHLKGQISFRLGEKEENTFLKSI